MCDVILFYKHKLLKCQCKPGDSCAMCDFGAKICNTCGGAEGSLTTHCPQERTQPWQQNQTFAGTLDFVDGQWRTVTQNASGRK